MPLSHTVLTQQFVGVADTALEFPAVDFPATLCSTDTILSLTLHLLTEGKAGVGQIVLVKVCGLCFQPVKFLFFTVDRTDKFNLLRVQFYDTGLGFGDFHLNLFHPGSARLVKDSHNGFFLKLQFLNFLE